MVLLTSLTFNLCFGPWEGSAWFEKVKGSAADLLAKEGAHGPLFSALYGPICHDLGIEGEGTWAHKQAVLEQLRTGEAFSLKGPRVTLRRWFSWFSAQGFHDRVWHQRLLAILNIALSLGVYSNYSQVPYWGGPLATKKRPEAAPADQEPHLAGQAAAARLTQAAMGLSSEARSSTDAAPQEGTALMRTEEKSISQLRRECGSTLWVACAILSRDNVQSLARLLKVFAKPFADSHFDHERSVRHPAAALHYYSSAAAGSWLSTLQQAVALTQDATALSQAGFDTAFAATPQPWLGTAPPCSQSRA